MTIDSTKFMYYRTSENKGVSSLVALGLWTVKTNDNSGKMSFSD